MESKEFEMVQAKIAELGDEIETLQLEKDSLQYEIDGLKDAVNELEDSYDQLLKEKENLEDDLKELEGFNAFVKLSGLREHEQFEELISAIFPYHNQRHNYLIKY